MIKRANSKVRDFYLDAGLWCELSTQEVFLMDSNDDNLEGYVGPFEYYRVTRTGVIIVIPKYNNYLIIWSNIRSFLLSEDFLCFIYGSDIIDHYLEEQHKLLY